MAAIGKPKEIIALNGARALPPLLLVLYHYHEGHGYQHFRMFDVLVAKSYLWVEFFFALSGFVLIYVYGARVAELWARAGYTKFLKTRLARLYPLHLATLLIMLAMVIGLRALADWGGYTSIYDLHGYHPATSFVSFIANLFLVQAWHLFPHLTWNGVAWFVSVEFFLCLAFPVFASIAQRGSITAFALICGGFVVLFALANTSGHGLDITYDWGIVRGLADFSIGAGMAMLYRHIQTLPTLSDAHVSLAQAIAVILLLYAIYNTGWSHRPADFWIVPPMMLLIFTLSFDRGLGARLFQTTALRRLGEWSFAIYIGQGALLQLLRFFEQRLYPHPASAWGHTIHLIEPVVLVIAATLWGAALYYAVEAPANAALRRYFAAKSAGSAASA